MHWGDFIPESSSNDRAERRVCSTRLGGHIVIMLTPRDLVALVQGVTCCEFPVRTASDETGLVHLPRAPSGFKKLRSRETPGTGFLMGHDVRTYVPFAFLS